METNLLRLAHMVPCSEDFALTTKADMVLNALFFSSTPLGPDRIVSSIKANLGCNLALEEVKSILDELQEKELILKIHTGYLLSNDTEQKMRGISQQATSLEMGVIEEWVSSMLGAHPELSASQIAQLKLDLLEFLNTFFLRHGLASRELLSHEQHEELDTNIRSIVVVVCKNKDLEHLELAEFQQFLRSDDTKRYRFLLSLIEKAVRYLTTVWDPDVVESVSRRLKGKTIYLDTNVIFRLLGLQGQERHDSVREVIRLCIDFGFSLKVAKRTVAEMSRRLDYDAGILRQYPVPTDLMLVGYRRRAEENYVSTYWYEAKKIGIGVEDYIQYYAHFDVLLTKEGIILETAEPEYDLGNRSLEIEAEIRKYEKDESVKGPRAYEHDSWFVAYVEFLQQGALHFIESPAWILTTDQSLVRFQTRSTQFRNRAPVALLPSQVLQVLRFVTPAEQYDRAFLNLFARSFIPSSSVLNNKRIHEILGRIARYTSDPELADKVLADGLFVMRFLKTSSAGEQDDLIRETLLAKAKETEDALRTEADEANTKKQALLAELESQKTAYAQLGTEAETREADLRNRLKQVEAERANLQAQLDAQKETYEQLAHTTNTQADAITRLHADREATSAQIKTLVEDLAGFKRWQDENSKRTRIVGKLFIAGVALLMVISVPFVIGHRLENPNTVSHTWAVAAWIASSILACACFCLNLVHQVGKVPRGTAYGIAITGYVASVWLELGSGVYAGVAGLVGLLLTAAGTLIGAMND